MVQLVHEFYHLKALITLEQVNTSVVEKKRRILISKTSMVRLTRQLLNMLSRCKKMEEQKVRLFLKQPSEFITWVQVIKENKIKLKLVFEVLLVYEIYLKRAELATTVDWSSASFSMQAHIITSVRLKFPLWWVTLNLKPYPKVGTFELKSYLKGWKVWPHDICFWSKSPPYPMAPLPSGITLIAA